MFILQEIQTNDGVTALVPAQVFNDRLAAESAFYLALSYAAVSKVEIHTVMLYDDHGNVIKCEYYEHFTK